MDATKPIIVVVNATSKQGNSVVNSLLQTGNFTVKATTRHTSSDKAKQLAAKGAEVVQANAVDAAQRLEAFEGAYGVFLVTTGPEIVQQKPELEMGKLAADAAAGVGVKVFVFSTLEDIEKRSDGKYSVPSFQDKAHIADYITASHKIMIGIYPAVGGFYTNWAGFEPTQAMDEDGVLTFAKAGDPDAVTPYLNPYTAIGPVVAAAFLEPERYRDMVIPVYAELLTPNQLVETFTRVTGIKARYKQLTKADMEAALPPAVADVLWQAWTFCDEFGYFAPDRDMELVLNINPHPETWADFLKKTGFDGSQDVEYIRGIYT